ncbi:hypothetical protein N7516_004792 [Penicillium verrucosum]|uniref:uncharacterized protein n=1 Tax=Penicillium verrucosum TaxID=60171 RepID=UPI002544E752|nr:uncharacterized protein N7516_004792 [Penicillium verrucosum]KAJ5944624.1 hypothetical protein N7516_004792 [Penicillium verrucosum]
MTSLTNVFTTVAALRAIDEGKLSLHKNVASYLPEFAANGKSNITVLVLLTHTCGFGPDPLPGLYEALYKTMQQRVHLNFMNLRFLLEKVTKTPFEESVHSFTRDLGMASTFFNKGNNQSPSFYHYTRMAPTEYQIDVMGEAELKPPQPVRGTVHDENAWVGTGRVTILFGRRYAIELPTRLAAMFPFHDALVGRYFV